MKQVFTLLYALSLVSQAIAQSTAFTSPYVRAGVSVNRALGDALTAGVQTVFGLSGELVPHLGGRHWLTAGSVGIGVTRPLANDFYIQVEANVEQKGSVMNLREEVDYGICGIIACYSTPVNGRFSSRATYLTLPLLAGYRFRKITLAAGPYAGIKLMESQRGYYTTGGGTADQMPISDTKRYYKDIDLGFAIGTTYALTQLFDVELRYSQGLISFAKPYGRTAEKSYHQTAQVGLRYHLLR